MNETSSAPQVAVKEKTTPEVTMIPGTKVGEAPQIMTPDQALNQTPPSLDTATPQAGMENSASTPTPEQNVASLLEQMKDLRDDQDQASELVREYIKAGGTLDQLQQSFASDETLATPDLVYSPEVQYAIENEQQRQQFLQENNLLFINAGQDPEQVQQKLEEYCTTFNQSPVDLKAELEGSLSPQQSEFLDQMTQQIEAKRKSDRLETVKQIALELGAEDARAAWKAIEDHPKFFAELGLSNQQDLDALKTALLGETTQAEEIVEAVEQKKQSGEKVALMVAFFVLDFTLNRGRGTEAMLEQLFRQNIMPGMLEKMGVPSDIVEQLKGYRSADTLFNLPRESFVRVVEQYGRYEVIEFLEDLDPVERQALLQGESDHRLSRDEIKRLFLNKLRPNDLKKLQIETIGQ